MVQCIHLAKSVTHMMYCGGTNAALSVWCLWQDADYGEIADVASSGESDASTQSSAIEESIVTSMPATGSHIGQCGFDEEFEALSGDNHSRSNNPYSDDFEALSEDKSLSDNPYSDDAFDSLSEDFSQSNKPYSDDFEALSEGKNLSDDPNADDTFEGESVASALSALDIAPFGATHSARADSRGGLDDINGSGQSVSSFLPHADLVQRNTGIPQPSVPLTTTSSPQQQLVSEPQQHNQLQPSHAGKICQRHQELQDAHSCKL